MERVIAEMIRRTDANRFDAHVLALSYLGQFATGLEHYAGLHTASPMSRLSLIRPASLASDIRRLSPDVVHIHSGVWLKAARAAAIADVAHSVYTDHGRQHPDPWAFRVIDRMASGKTSAVVAVSTPLANHLATFVKHPDRIQVIQNGVDTDHFAPTPPDDGVRAELSLQAATPVIGSVGRFEPVKGYDVMLRAFALLREQWSGPTLPALVLVGDGSERERLERAAQNLGIADSVRFLGWRTDTARVLSTFDLFSMSSHSEGTSVSLLEGMSTGICPVVTAVGGNPEVLGPSLAHRLVPADDPEALANAWQAALTDAGARMRDAKIARTVVLERYSLTAMVRSYEALYERLVA